MSAPHPPLVPRKPSGVQVMPRPGGQPPPAAGGGGGVPTFTNFAKGIFICVTAEAGSCSAQQQSFKSALNSCDFPLCSENDAIRDSQLTPQLDAEREVVRICMSLDDTYEMTSIWMKIVITVKMIN